MTMLHAGVLPRLVALAREEDETAEKAVGTIANFAIQSMRSRPPPPTSALALTRAACRGVQVGAAAG
jgi:hypothetical protein